MAAKLLAIDPGNKQSAFVCLNGLAITDYGILENNELMSRMGSFAFFPMAIEMVQSFGMAVGAEVFETVFWTGRFFERWHHLGFPAHRVFRKEVKMHLCGNMRAKDPNIRQALLDKLGPQGVKKAQGPTYGISKDCWSALAVGVTFQETVAMVAADELRSLVRAAE